nr:immunoglobulin heavy chain junction region [Macaca mulatta]
CSRYCSGIYCQYYYALDSW